MWNMQDGAGWYQITGIPPEAQIKTNKNTLEEREFFGFPQCVDFFESLHSGQARLRNFTELLAKCTVTEYF